MTTHIEDRLAIADLMNGWMHRDLSQWDQLRTLFHPDGTIEVTWFEGLASAFIDASIGMGASRLRTKHVIASPLITFHGDKAIAETNAIIVAEHLDLGLGCESHNRFYDLVEKRDGVWRIVHRQSIYDMGTFTFPAGIKTIDPDVVARYPREYAPLAYLLEQGGFPVHRIFATRGSALETQMKADGQRWQRG